MEINSIRQITVPIIENPIGVDAYAKNLQLLLAANLDWLSASYPKATFEKDFNINVGSESVVPKVYVKNREFVTVLPDDSFPAFSFIYESQGGSERIILESKRTTNFNIVFFANLEQIDINNDTLFLENLKEDVIKVLRDNEPLTIDWDSVQVYKGIDDTYQDFTFGNTINKDYFTQNYAAFRISFEATYLIDCISNVQIETTSEGLFIVTSEGLKIKIIQ